MSDKPKIELRSVKYSAFASQETSCYSATLFVDGEKWGTVGNEGHGGADYFHGVAGRTYAHVEILNGRIAESYPRVELGSGLGTVKATLETVCGELLMDVLVAKDLTRAFKTKLVYTRSDKDGVWETSLKQKGKLFTHEVVAAALQDRVPGFVSLNALPFEEALAIYRRNGK